jgi:23S rRNA pseudouridine1911/1915/1917 synthase
LVLQRLDYLVAKKLGVSRSVAAKLVAEEKVKVDGKIKSKPSQKLEDDAMLRIDYDSKQKPPELDLEIIYEDDDCVVINKPEGLLAHTKGAFSEEATVASWLEPKTSGFGKNNRAGIVHRLDRGTSGIMICAKNPAALVFFQKQFSSRKVKKRYYALIDGKIEPSEAIIDVPIERNPKDPKRFKASANGKPAKTLYKPAGSVKSDDTACTLLELVPKTGRTHQLRVHLAYMKHPIVGDDFYGGVKADRLYLHAYSLELTLPAGSRKVFTTDLPASFSKPKILDNV